MSASRALVLGVDGGGTSTIAWLAEAQGRILGKGQAGPSNMKSVGRDAALAALREAAAKALRDAGLDRAGVEAACLGLAGCDRPEDHLALDEFGVMDEDRCQVRRRVIVNDGELVLAAGTRENWGVAVIAGTGSIAVGRAPDGRKARAGGWGPLIGDEGSGYQAVLQAFSLVARRTDGRAPRPDPDPLAERLCAAMGAATPAQIVTRIYSDEWDRARLAGLAPIIVEAISVDEGVFREILGPAGVRLAELVLAVARSLTFPASGTIPLAIAGSFALRATPTREALMEELGRSAWTFEPRLVEEPVLGALALAREALS